MSLDLSMSEDQKRRYGEALRQGARRISECQSISMDKAAEMLGAALGRGVAAVYKWFLGQHVPTTAKEIEALVWVIRKKSDCNEAWFKEFLKVAHYPTEKQGPLLKNLFPLSPPSVDRPGRPFLTGLPITDPHYFFGRTELLANIFAGWRHPPLQTVHIAGLKRSGKTSLLYYLKNITTAGNLRSRQKMDWLPYPERHLWVFIDFQESHLCTKEGLFGHILANLGLPIPFPCEYQSFKKALIAAAGSDKCIMLLMDELGAAVEAPDFNGEFWSNMRALIGGFPDHRLGVAIVSPADAAEIARKQGIVSPFLNLFPLRDTLDPLAETEAYELIGSSPLPFTSADIEWVLQNSGRWPSLLSILCSYRLRALQQPDTSTEWQANGLSAIANFRYLLEE